MPKARDIGLFEVRDGHPYDAMNYGYHVDAYGRKLRNRPYNIQDLADQAGNYAQDIPQMAYRPNDIVDQQDANHTINTANNFSYDVLGQRTKDKKADIELIEWTAAGKMKRVQHTTASGKPDIRFAYDASGNRIMKQVGDPDVDPTGYREWYVPDAQGNIMAVYRYTNTGPKSLKVVERPVYGSKRLGSYTRAMELVGEQTIINYPYTQPMQAPLKRYELTDHLGNVATVVTGRLLPLLGPGIQYQAEVVSASLHEPFGLELTGMNWQSDVSRFGFQNQIKDLELNTIHFKCREYSPADGVFTTTDPLWAKYPWNSPYAFAENKVIQFIELEGLEIAESAANSGSTKKAEPPTLTGALMEGSDINQNTLLAPVTIKPQIPAKLGPLPTADNTDRLGYFKSPSAREREANPVGSLLKDISLPIINNLSPIGLVDNLFGMATDDGFSAGQVTTATIDAMFSGVGMKGRGTSWSSVRRGYWKDRAANAIEGEFSPNNMLRMQKGNAPLHDALGVSMELHHVNPVRKGGSHDYNNLIEVWPWEHSAIDPYRHYKGPVPND